ncbi:MAG TPA: methyltransferase domain-containing protein, partial [Candidatus Cloacimonadota bacterium]|nr:methyltransferase domain-containing protein [Candidatus Cloacimonadota bacterium]
MKILQGTSISKGLAIGRVRSLEHKQHQIPLDDITTAEIGLELAKYTRAKAEVQSDMEEFLNQENLHDHEKAIIATHLEILLDPELEAQITTDITNNLTNAANALWSSYSRAIDFFRDMQNDMFAQRAADYRDVAHQLLDQLLNTSADDLGNLDSDHIPLLVEPIPSLVSKLHKLGIRAIICENCSYNSHAAILSRALGMAVVSNLGEIREHLATDEMIIVDGEDGRVIGIDFTPAMIEKARVNAQKLGFTNVEFRQGDIENIPVSANVADVIVSNCVLNLVPDKDKV